MATWLRDSKPSWYRKFCCDVLRSGSIPRHVAFIMDGNRRFARKQHLGAIIRGHTAGFDKLAETLEWCRDIGITEVTVYAFSIENFKRSKEEVDSLMELATEKFRDLLNERDAIEKQGVCIRFFGNLSLLPVEIQRLAAEVTLLSKSYHRCFLNVCIAYTSQDEIARAVKDLAFAVQEHIIESSDVTADVISRCLDSRLSPSDPDIVIRTSGEQRLSDFLLWQCAYSCLHFDDVLWPEFSFWNFCYAILHYQRHCKVIDAFRKNKDFSAFFANFGGCPKSDSVDIVAGECRREDADSERQRDERLQRLNAWIEERRTQELVAHLIRS